jgi:hypothetical protein
VSAPTQVRAAVVEVLESRLADGAEHKPTTRQIALAADEVLAVLAAAERRSVVLAWLGEAKVAELLQALRDALDAVDVADPRERVLRQAVRANLVTGIVKEHLDRRAREDPGAALDETAASLRDVATGALDPPPDVLRGLLR